MSFKASTKIYENPSRFQNVYYHGKLIGFFGVIRMVTTFIFIHQSCQAIHHQCTFFECFPWTVLERWYYKAGLEVYDKDAEACDRNLNLQPGRFSSLGQDPKTKMCFHNHGQAEVMIEDRKPWTEMWIYNLLSCINPTLHLAIDHKKENILKQKTAWKLNGSGNWCNWWHSVAVKVKAERDRSAAPSWKWLIWEN